MRTKLKKRRQELNLTQSDLAEMVGVSKLTIGRFERGETDLKSEKFTQVLDALGFSHDERMSAYDAEIARIDKKMHEIDLRLNRIDANQKIVLNNIRNLKLK